MKRLLTTFGAVIAIMAGLLITAPTASATVPGLCPGSEIDTYYVRVGGAGNTGTIYATIHLYYSSANGGTNCAILHKNRWHNEKRNDMFIGINKCGTRGCTTGNNFAQSDHSLDQTPQGYFHYAGPVEVRQAAGECVYLSAHMWSNADASGTRAWRTIGGQHCG
jgi:hypothetical protein